MGRSFIDRTDPTFDALGRREVINVRCKCGREAQIAPYQLIGQHGIQKTYKGLELARSVPLRQVQAPAAARVLGSEVAGLSNRRRS
jgi:hypothetical protein